MGPHLPSCWPRSNWIGAGVTEPCTCGYTLARAQQKQAFLAELETKKVERQRLAAEQATALAAELAPIIDELTQARARHDWTRADSIKHQLAQRFITIRVTKHGILWYR